MRKGHLPNLDHFLEKGKSIKGSTKQLNKRYDLLIGRLKIVEDMNGLRSVDVSELSLVHDLVIPPMFKTLEFKKYDKIKCPKVHLVIDYRKMAGYTNNQKLFIHVF